MKARLDALCAHGTLPGLLLTKDETAITSRTRAVRIAEMTDIDPYGISLGFQSAAVWDQSAPASFYVAVEEDVASLFGFQDAGN
jgi:hypothetical protein